MTTTTPSQTTETQTHSSLHRRLREGYFIATLALSAYILLSLMSYHQQDPGWSHITSSQHVANKGGRAGAWFADVLLSLFGYMAYTFPLLAMYQSWNRFKNRHELSNKHFRIMQWLGLVMTCLAICSFLSIEYYQPTREWAFPAGGITGDLLGITLAANFNFAGAVVILFACVLCGTTLYAGISWLNIFEQVGKLSVEHCRRVSARVWGKMKTKFVFSRASSPSASSMDTAIIDDDMMSDEPEATESPVARFEIESSSVSESSVVTQTPPVIHQRIEPVFSSGVNSPVNPTGAYHASRSASHEPDFRQPGQTNHENDNNEYADLFDDYDDVAQHPSAPVVAMESRPAKRASTVTKSSPASARGQQSSMPQLDESLFGTLPPLSLLDPPLLVRQRGYSNATLEAKSREVEQRLLDFGVDAKVVAVHPGPVITRYELQLAPGIKVSKITNLGKDLARSLSVISVRVVDVIPGKTVIGLELPNDYRETVRLSEVLMSTEYEKSHSMVSMALGKDIAGHAVIVDLAKMPHLLVAGTTGSGKSVGLNAMLLSLLYKATPEQVRLILIDPKMLEMSMYDGIPHLLAPVVTDMKDAQQALRWCVSEMERRYRLMASLGVRNLAGFNAKVEEAIKKKQPILDPFVSTDDNPVTLEHLPMIVVVIDELADMMMVVGKKVETLIARIAQKARAAGIHMILATQRPSVDVLTGLIKSNIPTRISFQVSSKIDSRTILDQMGAEQLLGHGDMLFLSPGAGAPMRVHGAFVDDHEVRNVTDAWKKRGKPNYIESITGGFDDGGAGGFFTAEDEGDDVSEQDELYDQAVAFITETRRASISSVQRKFKIGYNRAARLIEDMESAGIVTPMESNGSREVLAPPPPKD